MKESKQLLISFDYELFLGENSGTVDNCIIKPTNRIIKILEPYHIKAIFFVDTIYLIRLKEKSLKYYAAKIDYQIIENQLISLITKGHYLFPHIHAHWLDASYEVDSNSWKLKDTSKYRFHNLEEHYKEQLFNDSITFLKNLILPINPNYKLDSYRAGGWCIQPFKGFKPYFEKHNIVNDFSVTPGLKSNSHINFFDFKQVKKNIYTFENDVTKEEDGDFYEFTTSVNSTSKFEHFVNKIELKILWVLKINNMGDGAAINVSDQQYLKSSSKFLSIDTLLISGIPKLLYFIKKEKYVQFSSHPKMLSVYNIFLFKYLLKIIFTNYNVISDFRKIKSNIQGKTNKLKTKD